ncbi:Calcium/proton exchanger [Mycena venus]|uniref:Calcium/proton exchanger n=1 Tax=Mycena venus TaxID=2733690 RepID=A0A8H7CGM1_9AGAR|nr:Calcium/proton exchanger [Mycena venus]
MSTSLSLPVTSGSTKNGNPEQQIRSPNPIITVSDLSEISGEVEDESSPIHDESATGEAPTSVETQNNLRPRPMENTAASAQQPPLARSWAGLNILFPFIPMMFVARFAQGNTGNEVFAFSFLGLLSVAKIFGIAMEDLTLRVDRYTGRFIRVLAGNTVELISRVIAIRQCQLEFLQASLTGSILINILLVLGSAFISGGVPYSSSGFGTNYAQMTMSLLMLGAIVAMIPSAFFGFGTVVDIQKQQIAILRISRGISIILLFGYSMLLFFQFRSHSRHFAPSPNNPQSIRYPPKQRPRPRSVVSDVESPPEAETNNEEEEEEVEPQMNLRLLVFVAVAGCALITVLSEYLVSSLSNLVGTALTKEWVGLILIPLAGTFTRHDLIEAAQHGWKDAMDESLGLSTGSSVNLALFIQPILILLAWAMHRVWLVLQFRMHIKLTLIEFNTTV